MNRRIASSLVTLVAGLGVVLVAASPAAGSAGPAAVVTPPLAGHVTNGETISISVGPNTVFTPEARIEVLECAAPRGALPTSDASCDGNTAQYGSVIVAADGSFTVPAYTLVALPNAAFDESPHGSPVCNLTATCVLYIGQNQNDFSAPKIFSVRYTIDPSTPTPAVFAGSIVGAGGTGSGAGGRAGGGAGSGAGGQGGTGTNGSAGAGAGHGSASAAPARGGTGSGGPTGSPWFWGALASAVALALSALASRARRAAR